MRLLAAVARDARWRPSCWLALHDFTASLALLGIGARRLGGRWARSTSWRCGSASAAAATCSRELGAGPRPAALGLGDDRWPMPASGVLILGITVQSAGQVEQILVMRPGDTVDLAGYDGASCDGVGDRCRGRTTRPSAPPSRSTRDGAPGGDADSERRYFPVEQMPTTEAGIDTSLWRDLYVVLGDPAAGGGVGGPRSTTTRWCSGSGAGPAIMALAGLLSLTDRRLRVGAPRPARAAAPPLRPPGLTDARAIVAATGSPALAAVRHPARWSSLLRRRLPRRSA